MTHVNSSAAADAAAPRLLDRPSGGGALASGATVSLAVSAGSIALEFDDFEASRERYGASDIDNKTARA